MNAKEFLDNNGPKEGTKLSAAIHEGVTFKGVEIDLSEDKPFLDLNVEKEGKVHNRRIWLSRPSDDAEDWIKEGYERNKVDLTTWLSGVATEEEMKRIEVLDDLKDYANSLVTILNSKKGALLNIKLIPNKEGKFSEFPRYQKYVEKHIPGQPSKLKYSAYESKRFLIVEETATDNPVVKPSGPLF